MERRVSDRPDPLQTHDIVGCNEYDDGGSDGGTSEEE